MPHSEIHNLQHFSVYDELSSGEYLPQLPLTSIILADHVVDVSRPLVGVVVAVGEGKRLADVATPAIVEIDDLGADDPLHRRGGDALALHTLGNHGVASGTWKTSANLPKPGRAFSTTPCGAVSLAASIPTAFSRYFFN